MAVKASGANVNLRLRGTAGDSETDINEEINGESSDANANVSLATLSTGVGFDTADGGHKMSEFFGYSAFTPAFNTLNFETVTYTGNGSTKAITSKIQKSASFNGSSSRIAIPEISPDSISMWINLDTLNRYDALLGHSTNTANYIYWTSSVESYQLRLGGPLFGSGTAKNTVGVVGGWVNVIFVDNGSGTVTCYINGNSAGSVSGSLPFFNEIGARTAGTDQYLKGKIDQVRFFNRALSSSERTTLYQETYASSTKSTTDIFNDGSGVALYELDGDALSSNFGQAAVFNGSSSYIDIPTIPNITGSGSNFSFSAWINFDGTSGDRFIMSFRENSMVELGFNSGYSPRKLEYKVYDGSNKTVLVNESEITYNSWHHVCLTAQSGGVLTAYLDGTSKGTTSIGNIGNAGQQNTIGAYHLSSVAGYFTGKIEDVRIYSDVLTPQEVGYIYNNTITSIPTDYVAYYKLDGNATDETTNYDGTANNVTYSAGLYGGTTTNVDFVGMAFQPDLVWIKNRDQSDSHQIFDSVRGAGFDIHSDTTASQPATASTTRLTSFDSNGFTLSTNAVVNTNTEDYVAWCWKAASSNSTNTNGTISSTVRANQDAGFSIVKVNYSIGEYTKTVGHGLSQQPELIISKVTDSTSDWFVFSEYGGSLLGTNNILKLNQTNTASSDSFFDISTSTFKTGYSTGAYDIIAYCFHSVDDYQRIGTYQGNGGVKTVYTDSNGDNTGTGAFKPRWVMIKNVDTSSNWMIYDTIRDTDGTVNKYLEANTPDIEASAANAYIVPNSTGWTTGNSNSTHLNASGDTFIYLAIA